MQLILASSNQHKIKEINELTLDLDIEILSKDAIGCIEDIPETGKNLTENAIIKAEYVTDRYKVNCFSEDTGLEVDVLDGSPGVHTARYAGEERSDELNMQKLLKALEGKTNRAAQFRTVVALILDGKLHTFEGIVRGQIALEKKGDQGFGYDPIFIPDGYNKSFAQLDSSIKNSISHRAKAIQNLIQFLKSL